jgi:hypothetical protein
MSDEDLCRELLADVRATIRTVRKLMRSRDRDVQVFAVDAFTKLSEMALALAGALEGAHAADDRNPLARRSRLDL